MAETVAAPESGSKKAKKDKPGKKASALGHNIDLAASDKTLAGQTAEIRKRYLAWQKTVDLQRTAAGEYRNSVKVGISLGKHRDMQASDFSFLMKIMNREPEDVDRETRRINWLAKATSVPIGNQLGLFEDGESVADVSEKETIAKTGGAASFKIGMQLVDNPWPEGSDENAVWAKEWSDAAAASVTKH